MKVFSALFLFAAVTVLPLTALANPVGVDGVLGSEWSGVTPVAIAGGNTTTGGNFGAPASNGNVAYNIYTRDDGNYFYVLLTSTDPAAAHNYANLYFDTTNGGHSTLGFEIENDDAFIPGGPNPTVKDNLAGTGDLFFAYSPDLTSGTYGVEAAIANSFFLNDSLGLGYTTTPDGTLVSLRLSQSFGDVVVGSKGGDPAVLGGAIVSSPDAAATPEPSSMILLGTGLLGAVGLLRKRIVA